jgi:hypothetical protein
MPKLKDGTIPKIGIGHTCIYYQNGDRNRPWAAIVAARKMGTVLNLIVFPSNGGMQHRITVRHNEDPYLSENEPLKYEYGTWDTLENHERWDHKRNEKVREALNAKAKRIEDEQKEREKFIDLDDPELESQIIHYYSDQNLTPSQIAQLLSTSKAQVTVEQVKQVLLNMDLLNV